MKAITEIFRRLRVKVSSLILAILVLGFGILVILNISRETELLVAENLTTARLLATTIKISVDNGMLEARPDIISGLVQNLKSELKDVRRLEVYRRNGVEAFSDLDTLNEVHTIMGLDPDLYARIAKMRREPGKKISDPLFVRAVETLTPQETYQATDDGRLLTLFLPLENRQECHDCHGDEHKVRGIVRVSLGLEKLDAGLRAARNRQIVIVILTIIGVTATLLVFMGRVVLRPIAHVVGAARQIGSGNFAARVAVRNQDEIGELGRAINDMAGRLSSAHENLEARNAELATTLQELQESMRKVELLEQVKGELVKFVPEAVTKLLEQEPQRSRAGEARGGRLGPVSRCRRLYSAIRATPSAAAQPDDPGLFLQLPRDHPGAPWRCERDRRRRPDGDLPERGKLNAPRAQCRRHGFPVARESGEP